MKTRIQLAGGAHGSQEKTLWRGELPLWSGIPGMRVVLYKPSDEGEGEAVPLQFRQVALEINITTNESEQVIYVSPVDKTKQNELLG